MPKGLSHKPRNALAAIGLASLLGATALSATVAPAWAQQMTDVGTPRAEPSSLTCSMPASAIRPI